MQAETNLITQELLHYPASVPIFINFIKRLSFKEAKTHQPINIFTMVEVGQQRSKQSRQEVPLLWRCSGADRYI